MDALQARELLQRYLRGEATTAEKQLAESLYDRLLREGHWQWGEGEKDMLMAAMEQRLWQSIDGKKAPRTKVFTMKRIGWAAAAVLFVVCGLWLVVGRRGAEQPVVKQVPVIKTNHAIPPGKDGAILTLADGRQLVLDSLGNGVVAQQNGSDVQLNDGKLQYQQSGVGSQESGAEYNTLQTPRGRQFQLVLPDGSKVWLNAASSITYPTVFTANERRVKITGEAYFEVSPIPASPGGGGMKGNSPASHGKMPFIVDINGRGLVEVVGTHFNINSYADEDAIKTTLLEGMVKVSAAQPQTINHKPQTVLKPGQQASLQHNQLTTTNNIDIEQVMAWKNGIFNFNEAGLQEVMRQLERWYDIDVVYEKGIPDIRFFGKMTKNIALNDLLLILQKTKVKLKIEGRQLIVQP